MNGMVYTRIIEGLFTMQHFYSLLESLPNRMDLNMQPGAYIVIDNVRIHHHESITHLIQCVDTI